MPVTPTMSNQARSPLPGISRAPPRSPTVSGGCVVQQRCLFFCLLVWVLYPFSVKTIPTIASISTLNALRRGSCRPLLRMFERGRGAHGLSVHILYFNRSLNNYSFLRFCVVLKANATSACYQGMTHAYFYLAKYSQTVWLSCRNAWARTL